MDTPTQPTTTTRWKVAIAKDSAKPMLGGHGLHLAFHGLPGVEVVALADSNLANRDQMMQATQASRHYVDYLEMLDTERPDIVVLGSRHPYDHLPQIEAAMTRGIHVYCEKPMAVDLIEADRIVALAEQHRCTLCVAHLSRYDLSFRTLKAMVEAGEIGTPIAVHARGKNDHRGGGEDLVVLGTHMLDLQTWLFGSPTSCMADVTTDGRPITAADRSETVEPIGPISGDKVFSYFRFAGGVHGTFESRRGWLDAAAGLVHLGITVTGTKGAVSMRFGDGGGPPCKLRISRRPGPVEDDSVYEDVPLTETRVIPGALPLDHSLVGTRDSPHAAWFLAANRFAAWDLIQSITHSRLPESNVYTAREVQEMIHATYRSSLSGQVITFPLTDRSHPLSP